ncbi:hypothetical protein V6Z11_A13G067400 [Gossypium hirsutum]
MESLIWRRAALSSSKHPWLWNQRSTSTKHLQQLWNFISSPSPTSWVVLQ